VARAALARRESRGAHSRDDFQGKDPEWGKANLAVRRGEDGEMRVETVTGPPMPEELRKIIEEMG
jgi:succinate dehydrogenase / fumarate reductase flavoprotein subunit